MENKGWRSNTGIFKPVWSDCLKPPAPALRATGTARSQRVIEKALCRRSPAGRLRGISAGLQEKLTVTESPRATDAVNIR